MEGLAGGSTGAVLGGLVALMNGLFRYGFSAWTEVSWVAVGRSLALAAGVGCLLSLLGVLYPAIVAARMQPVEAMRVEE